MRDPLQLELAAGRNELVFLCDNMGRLSQGSLPDRKGIRGPAFIDAQRQTLPQGQWSVPEDAPSNSWQFQTYCTYASTGSPTWSAPTCSLGNKLHRVSYLLTPRADGGMKLSLLSFPQYAWVLVNGRVIGEHAGDMSFIDGVDFSSFVLDEYLSEHPVRLDIVFYGDVPPDFDSHVALYGYPKSAKLHDWLVVAGTQPHSRRRRARPLARPHIPDARCARAGPFSACMIGRRPGHRAMRKVRIRARCRCVLA